MGHDRIRLRTKALFLGLVLSQAAHSLEEYIFRLYDVFAPARFVSGLVSSNLSLGFAIANITLVSLGAWCYVARVRREHSSATTWAWAWVALEVVNGANHLVLAAYRGGYFPGAATAPLLLGFSITLGMTLLRADDPKGA